MIDATRFYKFIKDFAGGKYPNWRIGQAFCNVFNITDDRLFYAQTRKEAMPLIKEHVFMDIMSHP